MYPSQCRTFANDFYPRSPCGERHRCYNLCSYDPRISIHALLAESDTDVSYLSIDNSISIHALLAESDAGKNQVLLQYSRFLSTLSLRRATRVLIVAPWCQPISIHALLAESDSPPAGKWAGCYHFYPRSPCGERHRCYNLCSYDPRISIHALLAESDVIREPTTSRNNKFLSTLSLRRATAL